MPRLIRLFFSLLALAGTAHAAPRPLVLELFTSQACSSCPPADALLADLAASQADLLPLDFHVDYWNYLSWHDKFSSAAATERQRAYAASLGSEVYTPQLVIDGQFQAVGSDRTAVMDAIARARAALAAGPSLTLSERDGRLAIALGAGQGTGALLLVGFDREHVTQVGAGENAGRALTEVNVVRSMDKLPPWQGAAATLNVAKPAGDRAAVLLQAADGRILAAAVL
jgi:hypothetical protein